MNDDPIKSNGKVQVTWDPPNQTPCSNNDKKTCKIKDRGDLKGTLYTHKCEDKYPCDPEIILDDGSRDSQFKSLSNYSSLVRVRMVCDLKDSQYTAMKRDPAGDVVAPAKSVVLFGLTGDYTKWHLTFNSGEQAYMCTEGDQINDVNNRCTVPDAPKTAHFKIYVDGCTNPSDEIVLKPS